MTVLFPFVPFLVQDLGMVEDPRKPGYYAGYLTAAMQLGRLLTSVQWGRYSDRHGRKPVIQLGLVSTGVLALAFGLCNSFWVAVALRLLQGMCDSVLTCSKTLVTEIFPEQHQARAISLQGATWGVCVILGPSIGGFLARPAVVYPSFVAADGFLAACASPLRCWWHRWLTWLWLLLCRVQLSLFLADVPAGLLLRAGAGNATEHPRATARRRRIEARWGGDRATDWRGGRAWPGR